MSLLRALPRVQSGPAPLPRGEILPRSPLLASGVIGAYQRGFRDAFFDRDRQDQEPWPLLNSYLAGLNDARGDRARSAARIAARAAAAEGEPDAPSDADRPVSDF